MSRSVKRCLRGPSTTSANAAKSAGVFGDARRRGRPAGQCPTREEIVRAGVAILTERGFANTGIDAVLRGAGVAKGSFYHYFASKEKFGLAVIDAYARHHRETLARLFGDLAVPPLDRFDRFLAEASRGMRERGFRAGCLVGNLGQEFGCAHGVFAKRLTAVLRGWQRLVAGCIREAQAAGESAQAAEVERLAEVFWIGWEGALRRARLERSSRPLERFKGFFLAQLRVM